MPDVFVCGCSWGYLSYCFSDPTAKYTVIAERVENVESFGVVSFVFAVDQTPGEKLQVGSIYFSIESIYPIANKLFFVILCLVSSYGSFIFSLICFFEQRQEFDSFLVPTEPSNPWIHDSVELWLEDKSAWWVSDLLGCVSICGLTSYTRRTRLEEKPEFAFC